jgi:hypothetical protein
MKDKNWQWAPEPTQVPQLTSITWLDNYIPAMVLMHTPFNIISQDFENTVPNRDLSSGGYVVDIKLLIVVCRKILQ